MIPFAIIRATPLPFLIIIHIHFKDAPYSLCDYVMCGLSLISLKELPYETPSNIFDNGWSLTEPQETAKVFKKYFVNLATDIHSSLKEFKTIP